MRTDLNFISNRMALWVVLFMFISTHIFSGGSDDSTKKITSVYDINDPRNPDCPCHKYQKLADEEYARLMKNKSPDLSGVSGFHKEITSENKSFIQTKNSDLEIKDISRGTSLSQDKLTKKTRNYFFKGKRKRTSKSYDRFKVVSGFDRLKFWRRHTDIDSCFKWK